MSLSSPHLEEHSSLSPPCPDEHSSLCSLLPEERPSSEDDAFCELCGEDSDSVSDFSVEVPDSDSSVEVSHSDSSGEDSDSLSKKLSSDDVSLSDDDRNSKVSGKESEGRRGVEFYPGSLINDESFATVFLSLAQNKFDLLQPDRSIEVTFTFATVT